MAMKEKKSTADVELTNDAVFGGVDYVKAFKKFYPKETAAKSFPVDAFEEWDSHMHELGEDDTPERWASLDNRSWVVHRHAWITAKTHDLRWIGASKSYKGLVNLKPPFDLVLYSALIWELQPKTIIEFGPLQGGSSLWFADQLDVLCGGRGEVHAFELFIKCVHPRAKHPRLHFHHADLLDLSTLDVELLKSLPHPWLVIDDAHVNLEKLGSLIGSLMHKGDYFVWEDVFLKEWATAKMIAKAVAVTRKHRLFVDKKYTDAYGYNVTCSPNGWFKKR
jgi:cephalosporin hydroxylase